MTLLSVAETSTTIILTALLTVAKDAETAKRSLTCEAPTFAARLLLLIVPRRLMLLLLTLSLLAQPQHQMLLLLMRICHRVLSTASAPTDQRGGGPVTTAIVTLLQLVRPASVAGCHLPSSSTYALMSLLYFFLRCWW